MDCQNFVDFGDLELGYKYQICRLGEAQVLKGYRDDIEVLFTEAYKVSVG